MNHPLYSPISTAFILLTILAGTFLNGCGKKDPAAGKDASGKDTSAAARPLALGPENFTVAIDGRIETGPEISGTIVPKKSATPRAQISGAVLGAYVDQGQHVGVGTMLVRIDDRSIRDGVTSARAAITNARNNLELARRDEGRLTDLFKEGAVSQRDVDNAHRLVVNSEATLVQVNAGLVAAQKQLAFTRVSAPIAGVVSAKLVNTGDIVQPGSALYTIVNPSSMELEALIPADQLELIKIGTEVQFTVTGYPGKTFTGSITRINPIADAATRQVRVYAEIPNPGGTLVGDLFAQGRLLVEGRTTTIVANSAIDRRMTKPSVLRVRNGKTERVGVTTGLLDESTNRVEIVSGVSHGDTLLTGPALQIAPGTRVRTLTPPPAIQNATGRTN